MPELRKLIKVGNSHLVSIPSKWLDYYEKKTGQKVKHVLIETNGALKISPYIEKVEKNE